MLIDVPSDVMIAATAKPSARDAAFKYVLEQLRIGSHKPRALREIAGRQFRLAQQRLALDLAIELRRGGGLR